MFGSQTYLEPPGLHHRTDAEGERKTEVKDDSKFPGRSAGKTDLLSAGVEKTVC